MGVSDLPLNLIASSVFEPHGFRDSLEIATALSRATVMPAIFHDSVENCMVAMELARIYRLSVINIMRGLSYFDGNLGWKAEFIISLVNTCGRFQPLQYEISGDNGSYGYTAWTIDIASGARLVGPKVDWNMVHAEFWHKQPNSKWPTMPDVMFGLRSATFWVRRFCPELLHGMRTVDELEDMFQQKAAKQTSGNSDVRGPAAMLNQLLDREVNTVEPETNSTMLIEVKHHKSTTLQPAVANVATLSPASQMVNDVANATADVEVGTKCLAVEIARINQSRQAASKKAKKVSAVASSQMQPLF